MVYAPAEDSVLLSNEIKKYILNLKDKKIKMLDMGSGSGIQALTAIDTGIERKNILCVDLDSEAIKILKQKKLKTLKSDLFSKIKDKFDLMVFNTPYLPEDKYDNGKDTTGGKNGYEIIIKFLKQAKSHFKKNATLLVLFSNLSKPKIILKFAKENKYLYKKIAEQNMGFFEKILVYKFKR